MRVRSVALLVIVPTLLLAARPPAAQADCPFCITGSPGSGSGPNVRWSAKDSLSTCSAGDSLIVTDSQHSHPARARIGVEYFDDACQPRPGVPPDSIWVTYVVGGGNLVVNDQRSQVFADDPTDDCWLRSHHHPEPLGLRHADRVPLRVRRLPGEQGHHRAQHGHERRRTDSGSRLQWDGSTGTHRMPRGVYLYRLRVADHEKRGRVVVLR